MMNALQGQRADERIEYCYCSAVAVETAFLGIFCEELDGGFAKIVLGRLAEQMDSPRLYYASRQKLLSLRELLRASAFAQAPSIQHLVDMPEVSAEQEPRHLSL
jgi:hypothetical protein